MAAILDAHDDAALKYGQETLTIVRPDILARHVQQKMYRVHVDHCCMWATSEETTMGFRVDRHGTFRGSVVIPAEPSWSCCIYLSPRVVRAQDRHEWNHN